MIRQANPAETSQSQPNGALSVVTSKKITNHVLTKSVGWTMNRYNMHKRKSHYGSLMDSVEVHQHAVRMGNLLAQIAPNDNYSMELLQELGKMILELQMPEGDWSWNNE